MRKIVQNRRRLGKSLTKMGKKYKKLIKKITEKCEKIGVNRPKVGKKLSKIINSVVFKNHCEARHKL